MAHAFGTTLLAVALWGAASHSVVAADEGALTLVADGLDFPSSFVSALDGSGRIFIVDYYVGRILVLKDGKLQPEPFLDIHDILESESEITEGETGLISLVLPPGFPEAKRAYVTYTGQGNRLILSRFALAEDGNQAIRSSEEVILSVENWGGDHHCGHMEFGADGLLYLCVGDSGQPGTAQDLSVVNGAILRLDVEKDHAPYVIPPDNPFVGMNGARPEIWVYGVRNPWRFSFDSVSGNLYVPDPGEAHWEELNVVPASAAGGANFGWPLAQGNECIMECSADDLSWPVYTYSFGEDGCSIIGGAAYRGEKYPGWNGVYVFGDFCTGDIWGIRDIGEQSKVRRLVGGGGPGTGEPRIDEDVVELAGLTAVGVGPDGEILIANGPGGKIYQLHFPTKFETGWQDVRQLQLTDLLDTERTGSGWTNRRLHNVMNSPRWRWTQPVSDLYRLLREWFG